MRSCLMKDIGVMYYFCLHEKSMKPLWTENKAINYSFTFVYALHSKMADKKDKIVI